MKTKRNRLSKKSKSRKNKRTKSSKKWMTAVDAAQETLKKTGQVIIMVRDLPKDKNNPFDYKEVKKRIEVALTKYKGKFKIIKVPNITNICYGRGVGYKIEEIILPKEIQEISATKIREKLNVL